MIADINPGQTDGVPNSSNPADLTVVGNTVFFNVNFFTAGTAVTTNELWKTDGTAAGTILVKDFSNLPRNLTNVNGALFFTADDGAHGNELWKSDGSAGGTVMVKEINSNGLGSNPKDLTALGSTLYFSANDAVNGNELWKSDGTPAGTEMVKDINSGNDTLGNPSSSNPANLTAVGSTLFFSATDSDVGTELWKSDGTAAGTQLVADINPGTADSNPSSLTAVGNTLFFAANDGVHGSELWKSDGTAGWTVMVNDIDPGAAGSNPANLIEIGSSNTIMFTADDGSPGIEGNQLWQSDGTAGSTLLSSKSFGSVPAQLTYWPYHNLVFFTANSSLGGNELYETVETGGTTFGVELVNDINPGAPSSFPTDLTVVGSSLFFAANDGVHGVELWKTDGITQSESVGPDTIMVKDLNPSNGNGQPQNLTDVNGTLFFTNDDGLNGNELWKSDGTAVGTVMVKNINPGFDAIGNPNGSNLQPGRDWEHGVLRRGRRHRRRRVMEERRHRRRDRAGQGHKPRRLRLRSYRPDGRGPYVVFIRRRWHERRRVVEE